MAGKLPPGAIVLISDGASNVGISPLDVARQARAQHVTGVGPVLFPCEIRIKTGKETVMRETIYLVTFLVWR